ncbi:MAG TPA: RcnB family protein [Caulobacteraceae bacterium]
MKRLLLSAAAVAVFAGPVLAQNNQGQDNHAAGPARSEHPSSAPAPHAVTRPAPRTFTPPAGRGPTQGVAPANHPPQTSLPGSARTYVPYGHYQGGGQHVAPNQPYSPPGTPSSQYGAYRSYQGGGQNQGGAQNQGGGQNQGHRVYPGALPNQTHGQGSGYQGAGQHQWNNGNNGNNGHYHLSGDWWHGHHGFDHYHGHRVGFWFAPGWGYYQVDPQWYGYYWDVGVVVPYDLRGYYVSDPYEYGLPPAPYGCAWIFLGDQIVLIDLQSGQILQIAGSY